MNLGSICIYAEYGNACCWGSLEKNSEIYYEARVIQITNLYNHNDQKSISESTLHQAVRQTSYSNSRNLRQVPFLSVRNRNLRLQLAQAYWNCTTDWKNVFWCEMQGSNVWIHGPNLAWVNRPGWWWHKCVGYILWYLYNEVLKWFSEQRMVLPSLSTEFLINDTFTGHTAAHSRCGSPILLHPKGFSKYLNQPIWLQEPCHS